MASRFQLDMLHSTMLLIARTDSESASLISSTVDVDDHQYILGTTIRGSALAELISDAEKNGANSGDIDKLEWRWMETHRLCTFNDGLTFFVYRYFTISIF